MCTGNCKHQVKTVVPRKGDILVWIPYTQTYELASER